MTPSTPRARIFIIDDDARVLDAVSGCLATAGFSVETAQTLSDAETHLQHARCDVIICDYDLGVYRTGNPGDELEYLASQSNALQYDELICFSGLRRDVPEGVTQFRKDRILELRDHLTHTYTQSTLTP